MMLLKNFDPKCRKRDRKATERAILLAASKLFAEKGYENTRTFEIAQAAGSNEALITRYFGGKEGLLSAVIKDEETLQIVMNHKGICGASHLEQFPPYSETRSLKSAILLFFKNGAKSIEFKEEFLKIGSSRCLVDPEMAAAIKTNLLDRHMPIIAQGLSGYPEFAGKKISELNAIALLLMTTNFHMNFQSRKIYKIDSDLVDQSLKIFIDSLCSHYQLNTLSKSSLIEN